VKITKSWYGDLNTSFPTLSTLDSKPPPNQGAEKYGSQLTQITDADNVLKEAQEAVARGDHNAAVNAYSAAIQVITNDGDVRMARARSYMALGQNGEAVGDILWVVRGGGGKK